MKPHSYFKTIRPDEVAECWDGILAVPGLYEALWACVGDYKAPSPEVSEEPCYGMDTVAGFWDRFSDEHKAALNEAAEAADAKARALWEDIA
jgi:hypothetical protein